MRRTVIVLAMIIVLAAAVVAIGLGVGTLARPAPDDHTRQELQAETAAAVSALMTFTPEQATSIEHRMRVAAHLDRRIAADYLSRGPDLVLAEATRIGAAMNVEVVGVGVASYDEQHGQAQMLVFLDQMVRLPAAETTTSQTIPTARWVLMRNVDGNWRLADISPVAASTS